MKTHKKKLLSEEAFDEASEFILKSTRALERHIYSHLFNGDDHGKALAELQNYQNPDGGFGHGLEPDIRLPASSPIATTVALQIIETIGVESDEADKLIRSALNYFNETFCREDGRWYAVSRGINDYPHASWWHYDESRKLTPVDTSWGNPTAEILAYGLKFEGLSESIVSEELLEKSIENFVKRDVYKSEHEVYCYQKLYAVLPDRYAKELESNLLQAVDQLVCRDPSRWNRYVPQPLDFVSGPDAPNFGLARDLVEKNLDFLVRQLESKRKIKPSWNWDQYESEWARAEQEWTGILTLEALRTLDSFERIVTDI